MGQNDRDHGTAEQNVAVNSTYIPDLNDKAMERRIVRKIDLHILPFICKNWNCLTGLISAADPSHKV